MSGAADPRDERNTWGGWYELALEFRTRDEAVTNAAFDALTRAAGVETAAGGSVVRLPGGSQVVCAFAVVDDGDDVGSRWAVLGLPLGSLARVDRRVSGYPFGADDGAAWRRPLDVSGDLSAAEVAAGVPEERHHVGLITVADRPTYHPATA